MDRLPYSELDEWIEPRTRGVLSYCVLLNPGDHVHYREVLAGLAAAVERHRDRPEPLGAMIRDRNWRFTVVGCTAALLVPERSYLDDLLGRFRDGSWVAPQLAVALGLLHPAEARAEFERLVGQPDPVADFKSLFAAYSALERMGSTAAAQFEATDLFRRSQTESLGISSGPAYAGPVAVGPVRGAWGYWGRRLGR